MCVSSRKNRRSSNDVQISMDNTCMLHDWSSSMLFQDQGWISGLRVSSTLTPCTRIKARSGWILCEDSLQEGVGWNEWSFVQLKFLMPSFNIYNWFQKLGISMNQSSLLKRNTWTFSNSTMCWFGKASYLCSAKLRHWPKCECPDPTLAIFQERVLRSPEPRESTIIRSNSTSGAKEVLRTIVTILQYTPTFQVGDPKTWKHSSMSRQI